MALVLGRQFSTFATRQIRTVTHLWSQCTIASAWYRAHIGAVRSFGALRSRFLPLQRRLLSSAGPVNYNGQPRTFSATEKGTADIHSFFHDNTSTWQYIVVDPSTKTAVVIDTALDYDAASGTISTKAADELLKYIHDNGLNVVRILETHAHADHLTASQYIKSKLPGNVPICIGSRITQVQDKFAPFYGFDKSIFAHTFDVFLKDEEEFAVGDLSCRVMHLPGHTPDHIGYLIGHAVFTGDSIFMPDVGSARVDFPGGNAKELFASMTRLLSLPDDYMLFVGHDYPDGRDKECMSTVAEQKTRNKHVKTGTTEEGFIKFRKDRDDSLGAPRLLHPSLQVNVRAGKLPPPDKDGQIHMKIPVRLHFISSNFMVIKHV